MTAIPLPDLKRIVEEQRDLVDRRVRNVYQLQARVFLFKLEPGSECLLADLTPGRARVVVPAEAPEVPDRPPVFAKILRNELRGARVRGIHLPHEDRIVALDFATSGGPRRIVLELIPRRPNLLLLDPDGHVLRVLDGDAAAHRGCSVGERYRPPDRYPPRDRESLLPEDVEADPFGANRALDAFFQARSEDDARKAGEASRKRALKRLDKMRSAIQQELAELPDPEELRRQAEVLLAAFSQLERGLEEFDGIPLDPKAGPQENVDRLYRQARKVEKARPHLESRLGQVDAKIDAARTGPPPAPRPSRGPSRRKPKPEPRKPYRIFRSADGLRILVGKGGRDNDELSLHVAGPHDLFLHVRERPGAHVIVPLERNQEPPAQTLVDAATLALHYSKLRGARKAEIHVARAKHVTKPRGYKPGLVQVAQGKTLKLRFEPERLERLLGTGGQDREET